MELLTFEEVAEMFKVEVNTVKSWLNRKQIPRNTIFKIGTKRGTIRFIRSKLEDWVNNGSLQTQER